MGTFWLDENMLWYLAYIQQHVPVVKDSQDLARFHSTVYGISFGGEINLHSGYITGPLI